MIALRSGSASDIGRVRTSNQDVALADVDLFAVADGMGGHVGGEIAARVAVETLRAAFSRQPTVDGLRRAVAEANRAVWRRSQSDTSLRGMGTTLTATALVTSPDGSPVIALANVGDSRAYVYSDGEVVQVTDDHSLAEEKVRQGELTEAEAAVHPHRHILTRALGVSSDVDVDLWELRLGDGDRVLLCSDGLTNEVPDDLIGSVLAQVGDPELAAQQLVRAALDRGGNDNITVVIVDVVPDGDAPVASSDGTLAALAGGDAAEGAVTPPSPVPAAPSVPPPSVRPPVDDLSIAYAGPPTQMLSGPATEALVVDNSPETQALAASAIAAQPGGVAPPGAAPDSPDQPRPLGASRGLIGSSTRRGTTGSDGSRLIAASGARGQVATSSQPVTRRERRRARRRAGIPRLITLRVLFFLVLLVGVVLAGYWLIRWYANDDWYVTVENTHLVVYHGRPGGFLWYKPKLAETSAITTAVIPTYEIATVKRIVEEPTEKAAKAYIDNLHKQFLATQQGANGETPNTTTTTAPSVTTTTTTAPGATTTTTKPGTTTTKPASTTTTHT